MNKKQLFNKLLLTLTVLIFTIFIIPSPSNSYAQSSGQMGYDHDLETYLQTQMEAYNIPGLSIVIVRNGQVEYLEEFGVANDRGDAVTEDTPFLLASVSKSFTAIAVMQLVEAGKLNLDDPVQKHIPWFQVANGQGSEITVAHLLYHTSGLPTLEGYETNYMPDIPDALAEGVRELASVTINSSPGTEWKYSNLNYNILGLLIQEVTGQSYQTYIEANIFVPLDMQNSYTSASIARSEGAASGYISFFGVPTVYDDYMGDSTAYLPAGGLWSTASDMSHYLLAHQNSGRYEDATILPGPAMANLYEHGFEIDPGFSYAKGWNVADGFLNPEILAPIETTLKNHDALTTIFHEGDWPNFKSMVLMIPEVNYGVVLLMNTNDLPISSVFRFFAWDVTLIATGGEAQYFPPNEPFLMQNIRWILGGVVLLLLAGLIWTARKMKRIRAGDDRHAAALGKPLLHTGLSLVVTVGLLGYLYLKFIPDNDVTLPLVFRIAPDLGTLAVIVTLLSIGWGAMEVFLFVRIWINRAPAGGK